MAAAREQIVEHGPEVSMATIADAAGVAVGTLYRNFPRKIDLVNAVITEHIEQIMDDIQRTSARVADGAPAGEELRGLARRILDEAARNHAVKSAAGFIGDPGYADAEQRAMRSLTAMVQACIEAGVLASDVGPADFQLLVATAPVDQPEPARQRWLDIFLAGLAPR
nr:helix-turn-helix domain-containing protein [Flexivirga meconopsidis]